MKDVKLLTGIEKIIWWLTVVLFTSFYLLEENTNATLILMVIIAFIFFLDAFCIGRGKYQVFYSKLNIFAIPFVIFCFASSFWAINAAYAIEKGITITSILMCMFVINNFYSKYENISLCINTVWMSGVLLIVYSFLFYGSNIIIGTIMHGERLPTAFSNVNLIGMLCALNIVISVYRAVYDHRNRFLFSVLPAAVIIIATGSRKALVMAVLGIILLFIIKSLEEGSVYAALKIIAILIVSLILINALAGLPFLSGIMSRMNGLFALFTGKGVVDSSALLRQRYIEIGLEQFRQNPFVGIGMGNACIITYAQTGHNAYLHNNYVELLANGGIVGFLLYYNIYLYLVVSLIKRIKYKVPYNTILLVVLVLMLIMEYGAVDYYSKTTYFYFMIIFMHLQKSSGYQNQEIEHENNSLY